MKQLKLSYSDNFELPPLNELYSRIRTDTVQSDLIFYFTVNCEGETIDEKVTLDEGLAYFDELKKYAFQEIKERFIDFDIEFSLDKIEHKKVVNIETIHFLPREYTVGFSNLDIGNHKKLGEGVRYSGDNYEKANKTLDIVKEKLNDGSRHQRYRIPHIALNGKKIAVHRDTFTTVEEITQNP